MNATLTANSAIFPSTYVTQTVRTFGWQLGQGWWHDQDGDDGGAAGVREPRRPFPGASPAAEALPVPLSAGG